MVDLDGITLGSTYRFIIEQSGSEYEAVIEMDTSMSPTTDTVVGMVRDSNYPTNNGWVDEQFRVHRDGTVDQIGSPFGPIGEVVSVEEVND